MIKSTRVTLLVLLSLSLSVAADVTQLNQCLNLSSTGGTGWFDKPTNDPMYMARLPYSDCKSRCGAFSRLEKFSWSVFSQQFSAWLLPWLALISQLPFGAESLLDNFISGQFSS